MPPKNSIAPLVLQGKLLINNKTELIMYGENHSSIDNAFYEQLPPFPAAAIILVEHSTNSCDITANTEHLFQLHAKGVEWVFYTQKKAGNPNVVCFDTRAEHGYLNAFEEVALTQAGQRLAEGKPADIRFFLDNCIRSLTVFERHRAWFETMLPGYFERSYTMLESQLQTVIALLKRRKSGQIMVLQMPLDQLLPGVAAALVTNIQRVASVSVDVNLKLLIEHWATAGAPKIFVFAGKNHVVRMSQLLKFKKQPLTTAVASMELEGDMSLDKQIIIECNTGK